MYLVHAKPGDELDALQNERSSLGMRWRKMTEVLVKTQLHVISPFGFTPDTASMHLFAQEMTKVMSRVDPKRDTELIQDLQTVNKDIWGVLVKRAFGVIELKWLDIPVARSLALGISSNLTNPVTLGKAEAISNRKDLTPEQKLDAIHDDVLAPSYKTAMSSMGLSTSDDSFAMVNASIQVLGGSDPVVAQTMQMGLSALISKVPLLRGEVK
jgi:hypothetical protein